jgi:hypothetical protein
MNLGTTFSKAVVDLYRMLWPDLKAKEKRQWAREWATYLRALHLACPGLFDQVDVAELTRPPSLADFGVRVVGCSMCLGFYEDETCPCGNKGLRPRKKAKRAKRKAVRR